MAALSGCGGQTTDSIRSEVKQGALPARTGYGGAFCFVAYISVQGRGAAMVAPDPLSSRRPLWRDVAGPEK